MNTRLSQDAADSLAAYEAQQAFRDSERARWARAQPQKIVGMWAPAWTEQERLQHEQDVILFNLPF